MNFVKWLYAQTHREDPVGQLARAVADAEERPHGNSGLDRWRAFLPRITTQPDAEQALAQAWNEWKHPVP